MPPTEDDFYIAEVTTVTVEVVFRQSDCRLIFPRLGSFLAIGPPKIVGKLGRAPRWEVEWLARVLAENKLKPVHGAKVLVVEDDLMIADHLEMILDEGGYQVCGIAGNVAEAISLGEQHQPDLGVLDVRLRHGELGTDVAAALHPRGKFGVLYSTATPNHPLLDTAHGEGCLQKPYTKEALLAAVRVVHEESRHEPVLSGFPQGFRLLRERQPARH